MMLHMSIDVWRDCSDCGRTAEEIAECGHAESCGLAESTQPDGSRGQLRLVAVRLRALAERLDPAADKRVVDELRNLAAIVETQIARIVPIVPSGLPPSGSNSR